MRCLPRVLALTASLALTGSLLLGPPGASAATTSPDAGPSSAAASAARFRCGTGLFGAHTDGRVRFQGFVNGRLDTSRVARGRLPREVTGWGVYAGRQLANGSEITLAAATSSGRPELVTLTSTKRSLRITGIRRFDQRGFDPTVFVDGYSSYAYTVSGGDLERWVLRRDQRDRLRYVGPQRIASGFDGTTALTSGGLRRVGGVSTELLYAARADGSLSQVRVPAVGGEPRVRVLQIAATGYAGVAELSWGLCLQPRRTHSLLAVVPSEDRATWTTVERATSKPRATLQGDVEGDVDWTTLTAAY